MPAERSFRNTPEPPQQVAKIAYEPEVFTPPSVIATTPMDTKLRRYNSKVKGARQKPPLQNQTRSLEAFFSKRPGGVRAKENWLKPMVWLEPVERGAVAMLWGER